MPSENFSYLHNSFFINPMSIHGTNFDAIGENNQDLQTFIQRSKAYVEEYKFNLSIALSRFNIKNALENDIPQDFVLGVLIEAGSIAAFRPTIDQNGKSIETTDKLYFQPYIPSKWDFYARPTEIEIVPYFENGITLSELGISNKKLTKGQFEIIYLNKSRCGFAETFAQEALTYSMLNQLLLNNITAKSLQLILEGASSDKFDLAQIVRAIFNQNGILTLATDKKPDLNELLHAVNTDVEFLADKINAAKMELRRDLLDRLGVRHAPYEKKERLTNVEIQSQDEIVDLINKATLDTINEGLERVNKRFELVNPLKCEFTAAGVNAGGEFVEVEKNVDFE